MKNSGFGIASIVLGGISIFFFGSGLAFVLIAMAFVCAFIGLSDPKKPKWSGIVGASLAGFAMLMCCINIMIKTGAGSSLVTEAEVLEDYEDWDYDDYDDYDDWDDDDDYWEDEDEDEDDEDEEDWYYEDEDEDSDDTDDTDDTDDYYMSDDTDDEDSDYEYDDDYTTSDSSEEDESDEDAVYQMGDIWTVPGQWRFTILKVEETTFRDELPETDSGAVYYVYYRYENLGYKDPDGVWDGLYFDLSSADITDSEGFMGYSYPGEVENYATEAPVGGYAEGVSCIGVDTPGDFTIMIDKYDGKDEYRSATFEIKVK